MNGYDARWMEFGRDDRLTPKSKSFPTAQAREKFFERLDKAGKHVQNVSFADPDNCCEKCGKVHDGDICPEQY